ncbi:MAG: helix-turn-helix transcriptional regulator [Leptolyngbyaceae cyanobacterium SM2_5_2]|nr:helix-turn-helix transcriptional regulator [Leptolyngbyaceae cyanobacterium SM2_5_2]
MGKAAQVLKHVLEKYHVSQYSLAKTLEVERTNVYRWVHEMRDPTAETLLDIVKALKFLSYLV